MSGDSEGLLYIGSLSDKALGSEVKTGAGGKFLSRAPSCLTGRQYKCLSEGIRTLSKLDYSPRATCQVPPCVVVGLD